MQFPSPLVEATLVRRYKRFLADVTLPSGEPMTVFCPNTGTMESCGKAGDSVFLSKHSNPKRKYPYTWELTQTQGGFVGINTHNANKLVEEALKAERIADLKGYEQTSREVSRGPSRLDFKLQSPGKKPCWIEVKNATLFSEGKILFPDTVTARGSKHLETLMEIKAQGERSVSLYVVNRPEGDVFQIAQEIDPKYYAQACRARDIGVEFLALRVKTSSQETFLDEVVPIAW